MQPDKEQLAAWEAFLRAHAAIVPILGRELEHAERIPLNYYDVLVQLSSVPKHRLRLNELNQCLVLSQSALSRLVDRMVAAGLLERESDPSDRRGTIVALTNDGRNALRRAAPVHLAGIQEHFGAHITAAEARTLAAMMNRLRAAASSKKGQ
jgi:DNA-binding MarR family transcriptional regulator